jgi:ferric-dicitrate binding protein FerR (iron transport regulator)
MSSLSSDKNKESLEISRQAIEKDNTAISKVKSRLQEIERRLILAEKAQQYIKEGPAGQKGEWIGGRLAITDMKGDIRVLRKGVAQEIKPTPDLVFGTGDKITTGAGGEISLVMVDGSRIEIRENSQFEIGQNTSDSSITKLNKGKIKAYIHKMLYRRYEIHTPTVAVSIRGTELEVELDKDGFTNVTVIEGVVEVQKITSLSQGQSWSDKQ